MSGATISIIVSIISDKPSCVQGGTAFERARTVDGKVVRGVNGWEVEHQCRDWDVIFQWARDHRSGDNEGID